MKYLLIIFFSSITLVSAQNKIEPITTPVSSLDIKTKNVDGILKYYSISNRILMGKYSISVRVKKERKADYDGEGNDIPNSPFKGVKTDFNQLGYFVKGYKNGFWKTTYKNKLVKTESYENGLIVGRYRVYDTDGELLYKTSFGPKGNGRYKDFYYKSGILKEEGSYKEGKKDGEWCVYNEKGELKTVISYKDGNPQKEK